MRILHVTDCFHSGVATAIDQYARLTPEYEHLLLANNARGTAPAVARRAGTFAVDMELPENPAGAVKAVRDTVRDLRPDLVHAHSSFGGAYARTAAFLDRITPGRIPAPVVYTPHSFSFERQDLSRVKKAVARGMESLLLPLTAVGAPCADREGELMVELGHSFGSFGRKIPVIVVPNALSTAGTDKLGSWSPTTPKTVGVISRVTPQRDPAFFAATAELIRARRPDTRFVWIGDDDGKDPALSAVLEDAEVEVTGWLTGEKLHQRVAGLSLVIHTAAWDGFPMAVLEVRQVGVPLLIRDIPSLAECPASARFSTPEEAAAKAVAILDAGVDPAFWDGLDRAHTPEIQRTRLGEVYDLAVGR